MHTFATLFQTDKKMLGLRKALGLLYMELFCGKISSVRCVSSVYNVINLLVKTSSKVHRVDTAGA